MLHEAERCPYSCSMPEPSGMPGNIVPFMCASASDPACAARTSGMTACCAPNAAAAADRLAGGGVEVEVEGDGRRCCVAQAESSTALACRPPSYATGDGNVGFVHILGVTPEDGNTADDYFDPFPLAKPPFGSFGGYGLPPSTRDRLSRALTQFVLWNRRGGVAAQRPIVTVVQTNALHLWKYVAFREKTFLLAADNEQLVQQIVDDYEAGMRAVVTQVRVLLDTFSGAAPATAAAAEKKEKKEKGVSHEVAGLAKKKIDNVAGLAKKKEVETTSEAQKVDDENEEAAAVVAVEEGEKEKEKEGGGNIIFDGEEEGEKKRKNEDHAETTTESSGALVQADGNDDDDGTPKKRKQQKQFTGSDCVVFRTAQARDIPEHLRIPPAAAELRAKLNDAIIKLGAEINVPVYQWSAQVDEDAAAAAAGGAGAATSSYLDDGHHQAYEASMSHVALFKKFVAENLPAHCNIA